MRALSVTVLLCLVACPGPGNQGEGDGEGEGETAGEGGEGEGEGGGEGGGEGEGSEGEGEEAARLFVIDLVDGAVVASPLVPELHVSTFEPSPHVVDFDGDTLLDVITNDEAGDLALISDVLGAAVFETLPAPLDSENPVRATAAGDLDGDGDFDLVAVGYSLRAMAVIPREPSGWGEPIPFDEEFETELYGVHLADLDGDADLDIYAVGTVVRALRNDGGLSFARTLSAQVSLSEGSPRLTSFAATSDDAFLATGSWFVVREGEGDLRPIVLLRPSLTEMIVEADARHAGFGDLLLVADETGVLACDGDTLVRLDNALGSPVTVYGEGCGDALVDLDGDGSDEIVNVGNSGTVTTIPLGEALPLPGGGWSDASAVEGAAVALQRTLED